MTLKAGLTATASVAGTALAYSQMNGTQAHHQPGGGASSPWATPQPSGSGSCSGGSQPWSFKHNETIQQQNLWR